MKWVPNTVQVARALMQYNLAVTYANRTEFDKALAALTEVSTKVIKVCSPKFQMAKMLWKMIVWSFKFQVCKKK